MIDLLRLNIVIFDRMKMTTLCYDYISQIENNMLHDLSFDARYSLTLNV
jgi:thymidylate kinase